MSFDRNGWATGTIDSFPVSAAYTLFSANPSSRIDIAVWAHKARTFFDSAIELVPPKAYPNDETPESDKVEIEIARLGQNKAISRVSVVTWPISRDNRIRIMGAAAAHAIGGAGMDTLVEKATRIWQISNTIVSGDNKLAPLTVAAIMASVLLAPIVPPEGNTIFGVKGARERLEKAIRAS